MPEPRTDRIDVDARLQDMARRRMANDMRAYLLSLERRYRNAQSLYIVFDERRQVRRTASAVRLAVQEHARFSRTLPPRGENRRFRVVAQSWQRRCLFPLPIIRKRLGVPVYIANPEGCCFADASAGVVEEQQQCMARRPWLDD